MSPQSIFSYLNSKLETQKKCSLEQNRHPWTLTYLIQSFHCMDDSPRDSIIDLHKIDYFFPDLGKFQRTEKILHYEIPCLNEARFIRENV